MRVTIWLTPEQLSTLQDEAHLVHRAPKDHLEWLIEQSLATPQAEREALGTRVARLEQKLGLSPVA